MKLSPFFVTPTKPFLETSPGHYVEAPETIVRLRDILRTAGTLRIDQLERFFRNAADAENIRYYIRELCFHKFLDMDESRGLVTFRDFPACNVDIIYRRILAFWVIASFGYDNIREVLPLEYPSQFAIITTEEESYDLTICPTTSTAALAFLDRKNVALKGVPDDANHIAIVSHPDIGRKILPYGFDSYCILDGETKEPRYYTES